MSNMQYKWQVFDKNNELENEGIVTATSVDSAKRASVLSSGLITTRTWDMDIHPIERDNQYRCLGVYGHKLYMISIPI